MTDRRSVRIGGSVLIKWNRTLAESVLPSMSQPLLVIGAQSLLSFIAFGLIARWYVVPWLSKLSLEDRLLALIWPHVFRYVALTGFLPGQVSPDVPAHALDAVVYGDTISALLALLAVVMLRLRALGAIAMVWIFNIVGFLDWAQSQVVGMSAQAFSYPAGASAIVYAFYVPLLVVTHVVMLYWLFTLRRRGSPRLEGLSLKQRVEG